MSQRLIVTNVRRGTDAEPTSLTVADGLIAGYGEAPKGNDRVFDGSGCFVIPGLVEAHTHLDKSLLGMKWYVNEVGPRLIDRIDNERRQRRLLDLKPAEQAARQIEAVVAFGTTHLRSHVDIDTEVGIKGVEDVMEARERYRRYLEIDIVAFPQSGMLVRPGTVELMEQALTMGADVVGGLDPCMIERDPKGHLDTVFALAEKFGRPIDIHLHEAGEMGAFSTELILERTRALGMQGQVSISHAFCLGVQGVDYVPHLIDALAEERVHIVTTAPSSTSAPPVKRLVEAGIVVAGGSDGVRDVWGPYGNGDMLERAMFVGLRNNFRRDDDVALALDVCTYGGAKVRGQTGYGLETGCKADLVLIEGETLADAIVSRRRRRLVLKAGQIVGRDGEFVPH
ncbi:amidohydrolase family protein [Microvirga alba]|uniref:Amidohydrolase family protein n=1 Tax=Microvirga alba TaxID=2791025 RepID=A0A931FQB1_9HYPH|nr:amidohydrolase family protein [Microvirga alba]MBF9235670.1 amidohydrolase family protein [Microvirga alba]